MRHADTKKMRPPGWARNVVFAIMIGMSYCWAVYITETMLPIRYVAEAIVWTLVLFVMWEIWRCIDHTPIVIPDLENKSLVELLAKMDAKREENAMAEIFAEIELVRRSDAHEK